MGKGTGSTAILTYGTDVPIVYTGALYFISEWLRVYINKTMTIMSKQTNSASNFL